MNYYAPFELLKVVLVFSAIESLLNTPIDFLSQSILRDIEAKISVDAALGK